MFSSLILLLSLFTIGLGNERDPISELELIITNTKFPYGNNPTATAYDGNDTIYTWGGNGSSHRDIFKYSITKETLELIGTIQYSQDGGGLWVGNETLLQIGGQRSEIWSFRTDDPSNWSVVGNMTLRIHWSSNVWDEGENTYIIGGVGASVGTLDSILKYSTLTQNVEEVNQIPGGGRHQPSSVFDKSTGNIYIFGGRTPAYSYLDDIIQFNTGTKEVKKLNATLPIGSAFSCAVWTGRDAYIIGGIKSDWEDKPLPSLVRFNPEKDEVTSIPVINFPEKMSGTGSCTFVEKLNRIYMFSGYTTVTLDAIMYIDLGGNEIPTESTEVPTTVTIEPTTVTSEPTTETTEKTTTKRPGPSNCLGVEDDTLLPNPFCCESFFQCDNHVAVLHHCPDFLQFSPLTLRCEHPEFVGCGVFYHKN